MSELTSSFTSISDGAIATAADGVVDRARFAKGDNWKKAD